MTYKPTYPVLWVESQHTPQDVFSAIVEHLRAQGGRAVKYENTCVNRTETGRACAAACLMTDAEAESVSWIGMVDRLAHPDVADIRPSRLIPFTNLLTRCQNVHDMSPTLVDANRDFGAIAAELGFPFVPFTVWEDR